MSNKPKPLVMWAGGKTKMIKNYTEMIPKNIESYCEPFVGGGAMFIYIKQEHNPKNIVLNDIYEPLINIYKSIRDDVDKFISNVNALQEKYIALETKEKRKEFYYKVRSKHAWDFKDMTKTQEAAFLFFLMKTGFNGILQINKNTNGRYGTPAGLMNQKEVVYDKENVMWWHEALQGVELKNGNWENAVKGLPDNTFYFFDPPYRASFADYGNSFNDEELSKLIYFAEEQNRVIVCNRDDEEYFTNLSTTLNKTFFPVTYTAGRRKKVENGYEAKKATEVALWRNV